MQFGRTYEEFEVGAVYQHWPGKTVTEYDDHLFCLLTMNHHPLHLDAHYAEGSTQFGRNVVVGNYVYSLLLGMSVPDVSGKAIANLEIESLRHVAPTFHGDTIYGETTVLDKWESTSKDDRGIVHVETRGLQPGRDAGLHLPPQGHGAEAVLPRRPRRRPPRPPRSPGLARPSCPACERLVGALAQAVAIVVASTLGSASTRSHSSGAGSLSASHGVGSADPAASPRAIAPVRLAPPELGSRWRSSGRSSYASAVASPRSRSRARVCPETARRAGRIHAVATLARVSRGDARRRSRRQEGYLDAASAATSATSCCRHLPRLHPAGVLALRLGVRRVEPHPRRHRRRHGHRRPATPPERGAAHERHRPAYPLDGERRHRVAGRRRDLGAAGRARGHRAHRPRHGPRLGRGGRRGRAARRRPGPGDGDLLLALRAVDPPARLPRRPRPPGPGHRDRVCPRGAGQPAAADGREDGGGRHPAHLRAGRRAGPAGRHRGPPAHRRRARRQRRRRRTATRRSSAGSATTAPTTCATTRPTRWTPSGWSSRPAASPCTPTRSGAAAAPARGTR